MVKENNNILNVVLIFILGFFFSKLMPNTCNKIPTSDIINPYNTIERFYISGNKNNGIIQGFNVGSQNKCVTYNSNNNGR